MSDEEEGPLKATGISTEEIVALATRAAEPGALSEEEMAVIVSDTSSAEELRGLSTPSRSYFTSSASSSFTDAGCRH